MPKSKLLISYPKVSVPEFLLDQIKQQEGNKIALIESCNEHQYTYAEVYKNVVSTGSALRRRGFHQGDIALFYCSNSIDYYIMMLAVSSIGGVVTMTHSTYTADELVRPVSDLNPQFIVTNSNLLDNVKKATQHNINIKEIFIDGPNGHDNTSVQSLYDDNGDQFQLLNLDLESVCLVPYSSGTTGLPKGVLLTHRNLLSSIVALCAKETKVFSDINHIVILNCLLSATPVSNIFSLVGLSLGAQIIIARNRDFEHVLSCIPKYKVSMLPIYPSTAVLLAKDPRVFNYDLSSLVDVICTGGHLMKVTIEDIERRLHLTIRQGYGMTEALWVTMSSFDNVKCGSVGMVFPLVECEIVDVTTNQQLGVNESGEVRVRSDSIMKGYSNNEQMTKQIIDENGWLHTGDIGYFDEDGHLFITGRLKEVIKYEGLQVAPVELETALLEHPGILDAAVIGISDDVGRELPKAFVVRTDDSVKEIDIINFIQGKVAPHKRLRGGVEFVLEIPKTPTGKILRRILYDMEMSKKQKI